MNTKESLTSTTIRRRRPTMLAGLLLLVAATTMGVACGGAGETEMGREELVGESQEAATSAAVWTRYISEEDGQGDANGALCPSGMAAIGFECNGDYCDNVRVRCDTFVGMLGGFRWTQWVEHNGSAAALCGTNEWMTGVQCWGDWCDNVRIKCQASSNAAVGCAWTPDWYSEDSGAFTTAPGQYIRGVQCSGAHCDNKRYYVCGSRPSSANSCQGRCGTSATGGNCWCDPSCPLYGDCCTDYERICL
jgi:hypothetical protein